MSMLRFWVAISLLGKFLGMGQELCPASRALNFPKSTFHSYPISVYLDENATTSVKTRPCFGVEDKGVKVERKCATVESPGPCPVSQEFVLNALQVQKEWIGSNALCNLRDAVLNTSQRADESNMVNVFVLGGSFTAGVSTAGCCSDPSCDAAIFNQITYSCRWTSYLQRWLSSFGPHVQMHSLATAGYNMDTFNDVFISLLDKAVPKYHFTKNDLILLDVSVNDAHAYQGTPIVLERSLEGLIRRIYGRSVPGSMPTIVLLEMWMWQQDYKFEVVPDMVPYAVTYEKVARHYNISLWSYRDSVRALSHDHRHTTMMEYIAFEHNFPKSRLHMAWHEHLFYSDFLSAVILEQFHECAKKPHNKLRPDAHYPLHRDVAGLPKPLQNDTVQECDAAAGAPLLLISAEQVVQHRADSMGVTRTGMSVNFTDLGTSEHDMRLSPKVPLYKSQPHAAWSIWEDKIGRPGFMHEFPSPPAAKDPHAPLVFHLNTTHKEFLTSGQNVMMQILYLRTYTNAGRVEIHLCGNPMKKAFGMVQGLDALWPDHENYKYSLPQLYTFPLRKMACEEGVRNDLDSEYVTVSFVPVFEKSYREARGKQKFKLLEVTACVAQSA